MLPERRSMRLLSLAALSIAALTAVFLAGCAILEGNPAAVSSRGLRSAMRRWNEPADPVRIVGNVYFVGTNQLAMFLIVTPAGNILIDSGFDESVPLVERSVQRLGFRFEDIKILLASHAHPDHVGGHARVKELTGARLLATAPDAALIRSGGGGPLALGMTWRPATVDAVLADGDKVELGGTVLYAHLTGGHTPGATTWTTTVDEDGQRLQVVFFSSATLFEETPLRGNKDYPGIVEDFERSYAFWKSVPCDVFLAPHGDFFQLDDKRERALRGERPSPFIDREGWKRLIAAQERNFRRRLAAD
ncbi:MAG TPA: subclass B3 metallo-beta-lactamase [Polyangiaceae bacterium]|nr:subclass B3 metallo-beta-lactamase [Polyangiaceae bacterium]